MFSRDAGDDESIISEAEIEKWKWKTEEALYYNVNCIPQILWGGGRRRCSAPRHGNLIKHNSIISKWWNNKLLIKGRELSFENNSNFCSRLQCFSPGLLSR
jgi:hypothetical protein